MARDVYQEITDRIIDQLETGVAPWARPWNAKDAGGMPRNYTTGRAYRGVNVLLLWATGYPDQRWLTFKQARDAGGHVRLKEKGTQVILFKPFAIREAGAGPDGGDKERTIPLIRSFTVFNVAQIDGLPAEVPAGPVAEPEPITYTLAADLMRQANVGHGGNRAYYSPMADVIQMPERVAFESEAAYWGVALHELTHWSGHESRLDRLGKLSRFGTEAYAREELVAEMGAAFLCAQAGIGYATRHADYIASWLKVLKGDKKAIVQAASLAQAAADFINPAEEAAEVEEAA